MRNLVTLFGFEDLLEFVCGMRKQKDDQGAEHRNVDFYMQAVGSTLYQILSSGSWASICDQSQCQAAKKFPS